MTIKIQWLCCCCVVVALVISCNAKKLDRKEKLKKPHDEVKKVSSDRVKNGGNKGPMSGVGSLPSPFQIPLPIIPKKNNRLRNKSQKQDQSRPLNGVKTKNGTNQKSGAGNNGAGNNGVSTSGRNVISDVFEDGDFLPLDHDEVVRRMKRHLEDGDLSDDERKLRDEWFYFDADENIPNGETASLIPSDLKFLYKAGQSLSNAYDTVMPHVKERLHKRSTETDDDISDSNGERSHSFIENIEEDLMSLNKMRFEKHKRDLTDYDFSNDDDDVEEGAYADAADAPRDMRVREVSPEDDYMEGVIEVVDGDADFFEPIQHHIATRETVPKDEPLLTVQQAEQQLRDAEVASKALSSLEVKLGVDPQNIIPNTHKYLESLQAEKSRYDEDIRKHIIDTRDVERMVVRDDDLGKQKTKRDHIEDAKQVLANDRSKIEEIDTELKELKDIELMATGLEVAKFLAQERAETALRQVRNRIQTEPSSLAETNLGHSSPIPTAMMQAVNSQVLQPETTTQQQKLPYQAALFYGASPTVQTFDKIHEMASQRHTTHPLPPTMIQSFNPAVIHPDSITKTLQEFPHFQQSAAQSYPTLQNIQNLNSPYQLASQRHVTRPFIQQATPSMPFPVRNFYPSPQIQRLYGSNTYNKLMSTEEMFTPSSKMFAHALNDPYSHRSSGFVESTYHPSLPAAASNFFESTLLNSPHRYVDTPKVLSPQIMYSSVNHSPPPSMFSRPLPQSIQQHQMQQHRVGEQRHLWHPIPQFYSSFNNYSPFIKNPIINAFASKQQHKGHQNVDHTHKATDHRKPAETDWFGSMSFPGTTYSPPPTYAIPPPLPSIAQQIQTQDADKQSDMYQPGALPHYPSPVIVTAPAPNEFHSAITEISTPSHSLEPGVAPYSTLKPYKFDPLSQAPNTIPYVSQFIKSPVSQASANNPAFNNQPIISNFASPQLTQSSQSQVGASQVIITGPPAHVVTINQKPEQPEETQPLGVLPGYIGAVEVAKYPNDLTDRLRTGNNNTKEDEQNGPKREKLIHAEKNLDNVKRASIAVTNVENEVGFDPGSIVKMIDFVKTAAEKDVQLSKDIIAKDKIMINEIQSSDPSRHQILDSPAQKSESEKKSNIDSVAYEHAQEKLKSDEALLNDANDRLEKIKKMELVVTEIEVAKYIASDKAKQVMEGVKRTMDDSTARTVRSSRDTLQDNKENIKY